VAEVLEVPLPYPRHQVETRRQSIYLELRAHLYRRLVQQVMGARSEAA